MRDLVSLLTPPGVAAIATVRLRGPGARAFAAAHLTRAPRRGRCVHCDLIENSETIDDVVAVLVDEQTLDLSLHGGAWVVRRAMELARASGFEVVDWRDLDPDGADEIERDMLRDLPRALTEQALAILLAQPRAWREMAASDDRVAMDRALVDRSLEWLLNPPTVAIVGLPNAGKSTLANQLFARQRSITADLPGTTRDWVGEQANLDGLVVTLVDTPGWRETDDPIERQAIAHSRGVVGRADLVIAVTDVTQPLPRQRLLAEGAGLVVINKVDRAGWDDPIERAIPVCALTGAGIETLRHRVRQLFDCTDLQSLHARAWTPLQRARLARVESAQ